jgi:hypothetical protein
VIAPPSEATFTEPEFPPPGTTVFLHPPHSALDGVPFCTALIHYIEFDRILMAQDSIGMREMHARGDFLIADPDTTALLLKVYRPGFPASYSVAHVRLKDGIHEGKEALLPAVCLGLEPTPRRSQ